MDFWKNLKDFQGYVTCYWVNIYTDEIRPHYHLSTTHYKAEICSVRKPFHMCEYRYIFLILHQIFVPDIELAQFNG